VRWTVLLPIQQNCYKYEDVFDTKFRLFWQERHLKPVLLWFSCLCGTGEEGVFQGAGLEIGDLCDPLSLWSYT
jgi:hypothetical protein